MQSINSIIKEIKSPLHGYSLDVLYCKHKYTHPTPYLDLEFSCYPIYMMVTQKPKPKKCADIFEDRSFNFITHSQNNSPQ